MRNKQKRTRKKGTLKRLLKLVFSFYPVMLPIAIFCIIISAVVGALPSVFMEKVIKIVEDGVNQAATWTDVSWSVMTLVLILIGLYIISLIASLIFNQLMTIITQGAIKKLRCKMFNGMQKFPIRYFDTTTHGDIMSYYTNDVDTLRQMISQSFPQLLMSGITVISVFAIMLWYSVWLTLVVVLGVICMMFITRKVAGGSAKFFYKQQTAVGKVEGFIEEMMNGQKVVKVFCHEPQSEADFDKCNGTLFQESVKANRYANILMPILTNIGNVLYVIVAIVGGVLLLNKVPNCSVSGLAFNISIVIAFLNMTKQFTGSINQVSNQLNSVVMGLAGASRVFEFMDQAAEEDNGYVSLVNAKEVDGKIVPCEAETGVWAWEHPHQADGTVTYTKVTGEVQLSHVDFGYQPEKTVLHDICIHAAPGQKVAFVGATGAGKTTITNLLNRFYDIADGKIRYDGININKIKKADLRRSLGIVLQDTNLFTGTVMDNIRYGKLSASDEDCIAAAKLAGADDFITRLPDGYQTMVAGDGSSLSQGQRQLLSIARAAVADPPVMILDEATSSIDTRTEAIVQRGMDALMKGRTVFVIAHRLSTVKNSDLIIVLDHGKIIERGTHDELLKQKGQYYQLYTGAFELE